MRERSHSAKDGAAESTSPEDPITLITSDGSASPSSWAMTPGPTAVWLEAMTSPRHMSRSIGMSERA